MRELLLIGQRAIAGVEALRKQEQVADAVAVFGEVLRVGNSSVWRSYLFAQICSTSYRLTPVVVTYST